MTQRIRINQAVWILLVCLGGSVSLGRVHAPIPPSYAEEEGFLSGPSVLARGGEEAERGGELEEITEEGVLDLDIPAWPAGFNQENIKNETDRANVKKEIVAIMREVVRVDYEGDWGRVTTGGLRRFY